MVDENVHASYYEKMTEHLFISDILETAWLNGEIQIEIARAEIDNSGYDIILEAENIIRHVQLKSSNENATTAKQNVNVKLGEKPSGCVIWIKRGIKQGTNKFSLRYYFFGADAGAKLPSLEEYKTAKHTRGNASGEKKERPNIKEIPKKKFIEITDSKDLLNKLFNLNIK